MPTVEEAQQLVLSGAAPLIPRPHALADALGLVLAEDVVADAAIPPFANSAMDGYAVRAEDLAGADSAQPARLDVLEDVPAGSIPSKPVGPGQATRIMTGAPMPPEANAVVRVEDTETDGDSVLVRVAVRPGANVREIGEDVRAGQLVLRRGTELRPGELGLLAAVGRARPLVYPRPRVAVITTGDELVDAGETPGPGQIRDANIHSMCAQIAAVGAIPVPIARVRDRREDVRAALMRAVEETDAIITNGGISVGDYDFIKLVLDDLGGERVFWKVLQKPGGPFAYYRLGGKPLFGIPGNPVAAIVCIEEYVRPVLRRMMGQAHLFRPEHEAFLVEEFRKSSADGKVHFLRVRAWEENGTYWATSAGAQGSGILSTVTQSNALAVVPAATVHVPAGGVVHVHLTDAPEDR